MTNDNNMARQIRTETASGLVEKVLNISEIPIEYKPRIRGEKTVNRLRSAVQHNGAAPMLGIAVYFYDPPFVDMAAHLGFGVMWIDMEHSFITFAEAADLCRMSRTDGMLTMIRVPNGHRENVMKAAECGPDIIDIPMVECAEQVHQIIRSARFPPMGNRGFFSVSPSIAYGLVEQVADAQQKLNDELCLMIQIETAEAVDRIEELCAIPGVEIFIGPSDLSASLGVPGQLSHTKVLDAGCKILQAAKENDKIVAVGAGPAEFDFYAERGVDLLFCGNDLACMKIGIQAMLQKGRAAVAKAEKQR